MIAVPEGTIKNIKVTLKKTIESNDNIPIENNYSWIFNLNSKKDEVPPAFSDGINVTGSRNIKMNEGNFQSQILSIKPQGFFTDTYHTNKVNYVIKGYDEGSGISALYIKEHLLYTAEGLDVQDKNFENEIVVRDYTVDDKIYTFTGTYDFSRNFSDGIVEISFILEDKTGNRAQKTYSMIKDTKVNVNYNSYFADKAIGSVSKTESNKYFAIGDISLDLWATWDGIPYEEPTQIQRAVLMDNYEEELEDGILQNDDTKYLYKFENINLNKDYTVRFIFIDKAGNITSNDKYLMSAGNLSCIDTNDGGKNYTFSLITREDNVNIYSGTDRENLNFKETRSDRTYSSIPKDNYFAFQCISSEANTYYFFSEIYKAEDIVYDKDIIKKDDFVCTLEPSTDIEKNGYLLKVTVLNENLKLYKNKFINYNNGEADYTVSHQYFEGNTGVFKIPLSKIIEYANVNSEKLFVGLDLYDNEKGHLMSRYDYDDHDFTKEKDIESEWNTIDFKNIVDPKYLNIDTVAPSISAGYFFPVSEGSDNSSNDPKMKSPSLEITIYDGTRNISESMADSDGKIPVRIYYRKHSTYEIDENDIKTLPFYEQYYICDERDHYLSLSNIFKGLEGEKNYNFDCYIYLDDKSGNYSYTKITYDYRKENNNLALTYDNTDDKILSYKYNGKDGIGLVYSATKCEKEKQGDNVINVVASSNIRKSKWRDKSLTYLDTAGFILLELSSENNFYYSPYFLNNTQENCKVKNIIESANMFTVISDKKCFVNTVASPINFGTSVQDWEIWTSKDYKFNGVVIEPKTTIYNNYEIKTNDIPDNWYYAIIVYYADNTYTISSVRQNVK